MAKASAAAKKTTRKAYDLTLRWPEGRYLQIVNWDKAQSYRKANPRWGKIYTSLFEHPCWVNGSDATRSLIVNLWLLALRTTTDGRLWGDPDFLQAHLPLNGPIDLEPLLNACDKSGRPNPFVAFCRARAEGEGEGEGEGEAEREAKSKHPTQTNGGEANKGESERAEPKAEPKPKPKTSPLPVPGPLPAGFASSTDFDPVGRGVPGLFGRPIQSRAGPLDLTDTVGVLALVRTNPEAWDWVRGIYLGLRLVAPLESRRGRENCGSFGAAFLEVWGSGLPEPLVREILEHDVAEAASLGRKRGHLNKPAVWWSVHKKRVAAALAKCRPKE